MGRAGTVIRTRLLALCLFAMMLQGRSISSTGAMFFLFSSSSSQLVVAGLSGVPVQRAAECLPNHPRGGGVLGVEEYEFTSGYLTATDLPLPWSCASTRTTSPAISSGSAGGNTTYIGLVASAAGVLRRLAASQSRSDLDGYRFEALDVRVAADVPSIGPIYAAVAELPIPLANAERVSSRFIIVPLIVDCPRRDSDARPRKGS
jgi:hypothetical protein